eukprot:TRINITY_DN14831_c0_g1_i1.p1 TRINITY_DN14831_c0_g1~~TRINITY_DN14831_c0_g1_i1.p1  ORF type:complete len:426 (-),score=101.29 TRINITY_DN14831_c0_g1_i1:167-1444(-)
MFRFAFASARAFANSSAVRSTPGFLRSVFTRSGNANSSSRGWTGARRLFGTTATSSTATSSTGSAKMSFVAGALSVGFAIMGTTTLAVALNAKSLLPWGEAKAAELTLHQAVHAKDIGKLQLLLQQGADINAVNSVGLTPLHVAIAKDKDKIVRFLLENGANPNIKTRTGIPPLYLAIAESAGTSIVNLLLQFKANPNETNKRGRTPLHKALKRDYESDAAALLAGGANPNLKDARGDTPVNYAIRKSSSTKGILLALQKGADPNIPDNEGETAVVRATRKDYHSDLRAIIRYGGNVNAKDIRGNSVLHNAVYHKSDETTMLVLLQNKADPNVTNAVGRTPLHEAVVSRNKDQIKVLLRHGADANKVDGNKETPLHLAVAARSTDIVSLLLKASANPDLPNASGVTPRQAAQATNASSLLKLFAQ